MRQKFNPQLKLFADMGRNQIAKELQMMSQILDATPCMLEMVYRDIVGSISVRTGRKGMTADQVLRCALLKQYRQLTYEELSFHLEDSSSFRGFARLDPGQYPCKSILQENIKSLREETWEAINQAIVGYAQQEKIESGRKIRIDATAVETDIHHPTDATLLSDGIRIITRWLIKGKELSPAPDICTATIGGWSRSGTWPSSTPPRKGFAERPTGIFCCSPARSGRMPCLPSPSFLPINRPRWLNFLQEEFGHKIFVTGGVSSMILDCLIVSGNPADTSQYQSLLMRQQDLYERMPRQVSADGGFASKDNLAFAKGHHVKDVVFAKKCGLSVIDMAKSVWVYKKLCNFRVGIEAGISTLKRAFGLDRCTWKGWEGFGRYVWSAVVSYNLLALARIKLASA